jgi:hypothetical protein
MPSIPVRDVEELTPVEISKTTGLLLGNEDEKLAENITQAWSYAEKREGSIELKRIFSPIVGVDYEEVFNN